MRPIKFRCWTKDLSTMTPWEEMKDIPYMTNNFFSGAPYGSQVFMQFTGLLDKSGKEIYEGDIVQINKIRREVEYREGCFFPFNGGDCGCCSSEDSWLNEKNKNYEIIGNIYESPELLTS